MLISEKIDNWKSKLLDMGKRNRLLNYKVAKVTSLKIIKPDYSEFFKNIAIEGNTVEFYNSDLENTQLNLLDFDDSASDREKSSKPLEVKLKDGQILTNKDGRDLSKSLYQLRSKARTSIQEQGINILYLAFGFLEWTEVEYSKDKILSPLVLVPVELSVDSVLHPYKLTATDDDIVLNPVLVQKLNMDFGITMPELTEDNDLNIVQYLEDINSLVSKRMWSVNTEVHLSLFSFLKLSMYKDLENNNDKILAHPIIKAISGDTSELMPVPEDFINGFDIDEKVKPMDSYEILDADSSQEEAIIASKQNLNFVLQGPPGTGKSQTIANIIAQSLANGKKVLFVSEKMAALEVVYNRLKNAGLDDFCLELHSYKANKKDVISELGRTLEQGKVKTNENAISKLDTLLIDRDKLNKYDKSLHIKCEPIGKSIYQIHGEITKYNSAPNLSFNFKNSGDVTQDDIRKYKRILEKFAYCTEKMGEDYTLNPWYKCNASVFTLGLKHDIMLHFGMLQEELSKCIQCLSEIKEQLKSPEIINLKGVKWLIKLLQQLSVCPNPPKEWLKSNDLKPLIDEASEYYRTVMKYKSIKWQIDSIYRDEVYSLDIGTYINQIHDVILNIPEFFTEEYINTLNDLINKKEEINKSVREIGKYTKNLLYYSKEMAQVIGVNYPNNLEQISKLLKVASLISKDPKPIRSWFEAKNIDIIKDMIDDAKYSYNEIDSMSKELLAIFDKEILALDIYTYLKKFRIDYSSKLRYFKISYYKDRKIIIGYVKSLNKKIKYEDMVKYLELAKGIRDKQEYINSNTDKWKEYLGDWYNFEHTKWNELSQSQQNIEEIVKLLSPEKVPEKLINILIYSGTKISEYKTEYLNLEQLFNGSDVIFGNILDKIVIKNKEDIINKDIYTTDLSLLIEWADKVKDWFIPLCYTYSKISNTFKDGTKRKLDEIETDLNKIKSVIEIEQDIKNKNDMLKKNYGYFYLGLNTEWQSIVSALNWTGNLLKYFSNKHMSEDLINLISSSNNICEKSSELRLKLLDILNKIEEHLEYIESIFDNDAHNFNEEDIKHILGWINDCNNNLMSLEDWIDFRASKEECIKNGLGDFIEEVLSKKVKPKQIQGSFFKRFYSQWLDYIYSKFPCLQNFRTSTHESYIEEFKELDKLQFNIAQSRLKETLSSKRPDHNGITFSGSELNILTREVEKRKKHMPIRRLFQKIPNLLLTLKPCLLMSPLSLSLYLDPNYLKFDLVIFDEASQVCTEDAIGAIYRGNQLIVVGDREQLPPTNFFNANSGDDNYNEENEEDNEDYESILDECSGVLNKFSLKWHYRSRNEDLITFSNTKIYKNLITFPSAYQEKSDSGVEFIYVKDGFYDRSSSRTNKIEAKKVTEVVFEHIKKHPGRSLGVIAFSQSQQQAIDAEIRYARIKNPQFESFFSENEEEPFFIKNLENVQGDERDTIIFSIGYAKDQNGVMHMNFGPLNKQGGYRRLNVAITRAKYNIKIVSSIKPSDIDLDRTSSDGVRMLRSYLEYAIHGPESLLSELSLSEDANFESPFEERVYQVLVSRGYKVDIQVGCSGYRIDMAVKHPELSNCYVLGIECDGASYHSARTARERDRLREEVLKLRGWGIYRIWSTDWIRDERNQIERLIKAVDNAIDSYKPEDDFSNQEELFANIDNEFNKQEIISFDEEIKNSTVPKETYIEYQIADARSVQRKVGQNNYEFIASVIEYIVNIESPIHLELLAKRLLPLFGKGRTSNQIRKYIRSIIRNYCNDAVVCKGDYYWDKDMTIPPIRLSTSGDKPRPINYICSEEIFEVMKTIIKSSVGINRDNLLSETARILGYNRTGLQIKERLNNVLDALTEEGKIKIVENNIAIA